MRRCLAREFDKAAFCFKKIHKRIWNSLASGLYSCYNRYCDFREYGNVPIQKGKRTDMNLQLMDTAAGAASGSWVSIALTFVVYGGLIAAMYFIFFRPQSKKKKKEAEMRKNAQVGDEVTTIGGICGRIIAVKDETESVIIETGSDRARLRVKRWAIGSVDTIHEDDA